MAKYKNIIITAAILVLLAVAGWWWQRNSSPADQPSPSSSTLLKEEAGDQNLIKEQSPAGNVLEGTLKTSDNPGRGNLMLVTSSSTVYIFTSRDYTQLLNKEVKVVHDGTMEEFRLGDIIEK